MLVAAFIFLAPGADPAIHRKTVETPGVALTAVGVATIDQAVAVAKEMADAGWRNRALRRLRHPGYRSDRQGGRRQGACWRGAV